MKLDENTVTYMKDGVAPLVGAWIEMTFLKPYLWEKLVAPLVGAWIEICNTGNWRRRMMVAPLVGAWIEIRIRIYVLQNQTRRSPRGSVD